jgi:hypothetical protein
MKYHAAKCEGQEKKCEFALFLFVSDSQKTGTIGMSDKNPMESMTYD